MKTLPFPGSLSMSILPPMGLDDFLDQRQAQAAALDRSRQLVAGPEEPFEDLGMVLPLDADAGIPHRDSDALALAENADLDLPESPEYLTALSMRLVTACAERRPVRRQRGEGPSTTSSPMSNPSWRTRSWIDAARWPAGPRICRLEFQFRPAAPRSWPG